MELELMPLSGGRRAYDDTGEERLERLFIAWAGRRAAQYEEKRLDRQFWAKLFGTEISDPTPTTRKPKKPR